MTATCEGERIQAPGGGGGGGAWKLEPIPPRVEATALVTNSSIVFCIDSAIAG